MSRVKLVIAMSLILILVCLILISALFGRFVLSPDASVAPATAIPSGRSAQGSSPPTNTATVPSDRGAQGSSPPTNTATIFLPIALARTPVPPQTTFYVSKIGTNGDGRSWATAWTDLDQIAWDKVQPGSMILLDGGSNVMTYTSSLLIGQSGTSGAPITIKLADEPGRSGEAVIFGGRATPLPACDQTDYTYQVEGVRPRGIDIGDHSWLIIDGTKWRGITIYGHNETGVYLGSGSSNVTVRNVEIYDNGRAYRSNNLWYPDNPGVTFSGTNNTFERAIIHDNGQDAFQSGGGVANFTVRQSWLYNSRQHPARPIGESFNNCMHADGLQIYGGGTQSGLLVEDTILGPGLTNGAILGDPGNSGSDHAQINEVTIRSTLLINATDNNILGDIGVQSQNWRIENITSYMTASSPSGEGHCGLELDGSGHSVSDSIFYHGCFYTPHGIATASGNCYWETSDAVPGGQEVDPQFVGPIPATANPSLDQLAGINYGLLATSPCLGKGSRITSVAQLLGSPVSISSSAPSPSSTPSPAQ